jgi:hypothetical protein
MDKFDGGRIHASNNSNKEIPQLLFYYRREVNRDPIQMTCIVNVKNYGYKFTMLEFNYNTHALTIPNTHTQSFQSF